MKKITLFFLALIMQFGIQISANAMKLDGESIAKSPVYKPTQSAVKKNDGKNGN